MIYAFIFLLLSLVQVTLVGYNHKLRILLETVVGKIASFKVKPDRFSVIKVKLIFLVYKYYFEFYLCCYVVTFEHLDEFLFCS